MSLLLVLGCASVALAALAGTRLARKPRAISEPLAESARTPAIEAENEPLPAPYQIGDVLTQPTGESSWLAGVLILSESVPVCFLFIAPEAGADRAIFIPQAPSSELYWLTKTTVALPSMADPPHVIEHERVLFRRFRKLPLRAESRGSSVGAFGDEVLCVEYKGPTTERLLIVSSARYSESYVGATYERSAIDHMPSRA